jgi:hypothetical protein
LKSIWLTTLNNKKTKLQTRAVLSVQKHI